MTKKGAVSCQDGGAQAGHIHPRVQAPGHSRDRGRQDAGASGREYQISVTISKWRREVRQYKESAFAGRGHAYTDEARVNEMEQRAPGAPWRTTF
jgi:hypothetical protein